MFLLHVHQLGLVLTALLAGATCWGGVDMGLQHGLWVEVLLVAVVMSAARASTVGLVFALGYMTIACRVQEKGRQ